MNFNLLIKLEILTRCSHVSTTVWLHNLDSNKTLGEKAWWELHKNAASCFKQISEVAPHKTAVACPFNSHHTSHPNKKRHSGYCWISKDELISGIFLWTPTHGYTSFSQSAKPYIHQLCVNPECCLQNFSPSIPISLVRFSRQHSR